MEWGGWAEEEIPPPADADAPLPEGDPTSDIEPWELTPAEQRTYGAGFITRYALKDTAHTSEVAGLNHEADRMYRATFDHRDCTCWKQRQINN